MRLVDVGGRLVEVHVRESTRAGRVRAVGRQGAPVELVVPAGTSERAVDRALRRHAPWIGEQVATELPPVLGLDHGRVTEKQGRRLARALVTETARREASRVGV